MAAGRATRQTEGEAEAHTGDPPPPEPDARSPEALTLDFTLPVEAAERLTRLPFLQTHRSDRARPTTAETVWLDTADGALAAAGLTVAAPKRGPRVLVRTLPEPAAAWHPGMPPEVLRPLAADETPAQAGDGPLVAVAAFTGRRLAFRLGLAGETVDGVLLVGRLRCVAAERPTARLSLTGTLPAVLAAANGIAATVPLLPPLACLAEEGRALATGTDARPHRLGPPDTSGADTVEDAFLRAAGHLIEVIRQQSARIRQDGGPEAVHQTRVALRRLRSVLRVFRAATDGPPLRALDARLREVLSVLGPARDWDVFIGGIGRQVSTAFPDETRIAALLRAAKGRRHAAYEAVLAMLDGPAWRMLLIDATGTLLARPWREEASSEALAALEARVGEFARSILDRRWHRLRRAGEDFEQLSSEALHELRLDGKRLRYAAEVFAPVFGPKAARRFLRRVAALQEGLGIANDAAVARGLARSLIGQGQAGRMWAAGVIEGWCEARVADHRGDALEAWERLSGKDRFWSGD
ncbi:CHAD domain-containing protein [Roseomonas sp. JC162]|uniref:CHAD domain-containing protein n=1 Tax=Neoroseomonas marina TaxID=1232220 RepID=A0A848EFI4_9PROT|nr:CHAD domain-containing protein [Neoroseomonas marina]NMJ42118.1 CHAD domain-containing protein [Neoroseomonas marina]